MLHYSYTITACPYILQALTALSTRMSYRSMMALTSGALETCVVALETCGSSCIGRPDRPSFMLEARGLQESVGHALATLEPSPIGRQDPES
jgi:hypothetical protein